jgi:hypothetical protein
VIVEILEGRFAVEAAFAAVGFVAGFDVFIGDAAHRVHLVFAVEIGHLLGDGAGRR